MALTQQYVDSVLGAASLERTRPSLSQIKSKVQDTQNVLVGWEVVDLLLLLDRYYWDVNTAVDAVHDGKASKGDEWTTGRGKKGKKSKANQKGSQRSRGGNQQQRGGKGNTNARTQPGAPPQGMQGQQGYPQQRGQPQQRYPRSQQQQQRMNPRQQSQQPQSQSQQRIPQQQSQQSQQSQQQRHPQQQRQIPPHHRQMQHPQQQSQQPPQQTEVYNTAPSPAPAASATPAPAVPGLRGDWAKRAQNMKKMQEQQAAQPKITPQQAQMPSQSQPPQQPQQPQQSQEPKQSQQATQIDLEYQAPSDPSVIDPVPEMENLQISEAQEAETEPAPVADEPSVEDQVEENLSAEQPEEQPIEEGNAVEEQVAEAEEEQPQIDLNGELRGNDPLFLAPGLPGDSESYQFRFGAYGSEEVEEEKEAEQPVEEQAAVEDQEADQSVENKTEMPAEEQQPINDQDEQNGSSPSFEDAASKGQNVNFPNQGGNFENLDDATLPQVFYPPYAAQQMPPVFLPNMAQQASHMQPRQDPSVKNPAVDMTSGMPHMQSHPFPPSYFSSLYGSHHMMGADQQPSFPYNPLPSADPNAEMRMRYMLDQNLAGYHPGSFHQQHQNTGSQHNAGSQHEGQQNNMRGSPPINGNSQYGNGNSNSNSETPAKFPPQQSPQSMGHEMNGLQNSGSGMNLPSHSHQEGSHQGGPPQMGHQPPPQPSYPYFLPPFITQYPPHMVPMRGGPFFKGPSPSFPLDHSAHGATAATAPGAAQSPFFADGAKGNQQKHSNVSVLYGHQAESQEGPYEKAQSPQSTPQNQQQQNQGSFQGGYSGFPQSHMHSFQQPQN